MAEGWKLGLLVTDRTGSGRNWVVEDWMRPLDIGRWNKLGSAEVFRHLKVDGSIMCERSRRLYIEPYSPDITKLEEMRAAVIAKRIMIC